MVERNPVEEGQESTLEGLWWEGPRRLECKEREWLRARGFESQPQRLLAVCYWTSYLTSLGLVFLTCNVRIMIVPLSQS